MPEISDEDYAELQRLRAQRQGGDPPQDPPPNDPPRRDPPPDPGEGGRGDDLDQRLSVDELRELPSQVEERVEGVLTRVFGRRDDPPQGDPSPQDPPADDPPQDPPADPPTDDPPPREPPPRPSGPIARRWWGEPRG